jgi:competence protein ComGC
MVQTIIGSILVVIIIITLVTLCIPRIQYNSSSIHVAG